MSGRHRASRTPVGSRVRSTTLAAALIAGIGVAALSAATGPAAGHVDDTRLRGVAVATPAPAPSPAPASWTGSGDELMATAPQPTIPAVRAEQKTRPLPPPPPPVLAQWVNPLPEAAVTSCFGERWGRLHAGVDVAAPDGTRIRAAGAGLVVAAGPAEGYGNAVLIDHGNGYLTHYGHMSVITVLAGQRVKTGEQIGNEGSTGHSTGPHLHFEVHQGHYKNPIEPTAWLHAHGVDIPGCVPLA